MRVAVATAISSLVLLAGCHGTGRGLLDDDPSYKVPAIKQAVDTDQQTAEPQLVKNLDDDDPAVRFYAIEGLRRLTGRTFGYHYYDDTPHAAAGDPAVAGVASGETAMTPPPLRMTLQSDAATIATARKAVEAFAAHAGFSSYAVNDLGLCVNEALANVIRHAYGNAHGRPIELAADVDGDAVTVTLRDWGSGQIPDMSLADAAVPHSVAVLRPGGLGLPCLKRLLDGVVFEPQPDGMLLRMTKRKR